MTAPAVETSPLVDAAVSTAGEGPISAPMVAALEGAWAAIRARHPEVPAVVLILGAGSIGTAGGLRLGHFAAMRWADPDQLATEDGTGAGVAVRLPEVFVGGEGLARGPADVLGTLLHEAAHALAHVRGVKDTSRQGWWHNARFKVLAEELGIEVAKDGRIGWSPTTIPAATRDASAEVIAELGRVLRLHRSVEISDGGLAKKPSPPPCVCECGRRIRVSPSVMAARPDHVRGVRNRLHARPARRRRELRGRPGRGPGGGAGVNSDPARSPADRLDDVVGGWTARWLGWPGMALPVMTVLGCRVLPVVVLDHAAHRSRQLRGDGPQLDADTLIASTQSERCRVRDRRRVFPAQPSGWKTASFASQGGCTCTVAAVTVTAAVPAQNWSEDVLRLNAICPYYTMFPLDFPLQQLAAYPGATRVLDPFCGRGTTLYAARLAGLPSAGIDINPVAATIARAKLTQATAGAVVRLAKQVLSSGIWGEVPDGEFWQWCYEGETLREIATLRTGLLEIDTPTAAMLRAIMLGILHGPRNKRLPSYLSNQMPRTYASKPAYAVKFWKNRDMEPTRISTLDVIERRASRLLDSVPLAQGGRVYLGDSLETLQRLRQKFDLVVTSPPYYGMRTYVSDQWLRSWFLGGRPEVPYSSQGQIARQPNQEAFIRALADVWAAAADRCRQGSRLAIRFGALPSSRTDPERLLLASIQQANAGWVVKEVRPAGTSPKRARQAEQFGKAGSAIDEIDVVAELGGLLW